MPPVPGVLAGWVQQETAAHQLHNWHAIARDRCHQVTSWLPPMSVSRVPAGTQVAGGPISGERRPAGSVPGVVEQWIGRSAAGRPSMLNQEFGLAGSQMRLHQGEK